MPSIDSDDLAEIFSDVEMDSVTIGGDVVLGMFLKPYQNELGISGNKPSFKCNAVDVLAKGVGDTLVNNAVNYIITSEQPEDAGTVTFILKAT